MINCNWCIGYGELENGEKKWGSSWKSSDFSLDKYFDCKVEELIGKSFTKVTVTKDKGEDSITFESASGDCYIMIYEPDCCATCFIEDIDADISDILVGSPVTVAECRTESGDFDYGTYTHSFYHMATEKGSAVIRWNGESNGYYSEQVSIIKIRIPEVVNE